ncbi:ALDH-like protein [Ophiobolus disseminans]|uniref:ALDH-like protein n=1 Tax=Ophiobolus disseminans TaxID=1469910 RepID=A0A6A6ZQX0_9PLEO|nr:ALDH-like protein [Ophiobolus disseminans]
MSSNPDSALANLQATALTARCHNAFFRQKQLKSLHETLRNNTSSIKDAIKQDTRVSDAEATTEVALALDIVKEHYSSVDVKKELEAEYRITNGKDASDRSVSWGVVYFESQRSHTPFFSVIVASSAALAAGNCVAMKLEKNLRALPSLLRKLLSEALEADTFAIITSDPSKGSLSSCLQVLQETQVERPAYSQLVSPKGKVIAVVDRTADLASAAEQLVAARFAFGGTSPYAPDLVFVNEFIKKNFLEHVLRQSIRYLSGSEDVVANGSKSPTLAAPKPTSRVSEAFKSLKDSKSWKTNVITQGDNGAIIELSNLSNLPTKTAQPIFCITSITSLEHVISLVDEDLEVPNTLLAAYHFGTPSAGKYLSQFINADASFINHIPYRLLLGPSAPSFHPIDIEKRYTTQHFTRASPAYITAPASQSALSQVVASKDSRRVAAELLAKASQEIKEGKRADWIAIGYFEQGIFIGLGLYGIPLLSCIGASLFFGVRAGLRRWVFV